MKSFAQIPMDRGQMTFFPIILVVHIVFGSIAILAGVVALCLPKGQKMHRRTLFVANPRVFPDSLQTPYFQWCPVVLLFVVLVYWLVRVLSRSWSFSELSAVE